MGRRLQQLGTWGTQVFPARCALEDHILEAWPRGRASRAQSLSQSSLWPRICSTQAISALTSHRQLWACVWEIMESQCPVQM